MHRGRRRAAAAVTSRSYTLAGPSTHSTRCMPTVPAPKKQYTVAPHSRVLPWNRWSEDNEGAATHAEARAPHITADWWVRAFIAQRRIAATLRPGRCAHTITARDRLLDLLPSRDEHHLVDSRRTAGGRGGGARGDCSPHARRHAVDLQATRRWPRHRAVHLVVNALNGAEVRDLTSSLRASRRAAMR
mgnify:CR=1 FL=1